MAASIDPKRRAVETFTSAMPFLEPVSCEHLRDNDELLIHILLPDFARAVVEENRLLLNHGRFADEQQLLKPLGDTIEQVLEMRNAAVDNAMVLSFFPTFGEFTDGQRMLQHLGVVGRQAYEESLSA